MMKQAEIGRIAVVLVRARNPHNIGAAARAMRDFGFPDLRIVNEFSPPLEGARSAVDASSVVQAARTYATVAEAVAGCSVVAGTTAVGERAVQHRLLTLKDAAAEIRSAVNGAGDGGGAAILFGSEKTGLSNEELSHCNFLLTIPMFEREGERHVSMNLGQAVAVCLYELVRDRPLAQAPPPREAATADELERLTALLGEVTEASEYTRHHPARSGAADLRRLVLRLGLPRADVPVWMGFCCRRCGRCGVERLLDDPAVGAGGGSSAVGRGGDLPSVCRVRERGGCGARAGEIGGQVGEGRPGFGGACPCGGVRDGVVVGDLRGRAHIGGGGRRAVDGADGAVAVAEVAEAGLGGIGGPCRAALRGEIVVGDLLRWR